MSVFISHSSKDIEQARKLANALIEKGVEVWFDKWEILVGHSIIDKVYEGIRRSDYLAIILTKESVKSRWVQAELNQARKKEIESGRTIVLPLLFEECELPECLQDKHHADFRDFQTGMSDLLKQFSLVSPHPFVRKVDDDFEREWDSFLLRNKELADKLMLRCEIAIKEYEGDEESHVEVSDSVYVIQEVILEILSHALSEAEALKVANIFPGWDETIAAGWKFVNFLSSKVKNLRTTSDVEKAIISAIEQGYMYSFKISIEFGGGAGNYLFREIMIRANRFASGVMTLDERRSDLAQPLRGFSVSERLDSLCCRKCGMKLEDVFDHIEYSRLLKGSWKNRTACPNRFCPNYGKYVSL